MFIGSLYLLGSYSAFVTITWVTLYVIINYFQAGCCVGCPYRGKYCPAFVGVYFGNILSGILYKNRQFEAKFFKQNATGGEITLVTFLLFPMYWIFLSGWYYVLIYLGLLVAHIVLFMPKQCPKCSFNDTCPGGGAYKSYCKLFKRNNKVKSA
ncbi:MAG: hypothetical protein GVY19_11625 [Bacteroidetes bacterium]|jgi:hypothetical protein|nr:hypothetical protein [Bacteroidota bacterium]